MNRRIVMVAVFWVLGCDARSLGAETRDRADGSAGRTAGEDGTSTDPDGRGDPSCVSIGGTCPWVPKDAGSGIVTDAESAVEPDEAEGGHTDAAASPHDCRDDWPEFPWTREHEEECNKCWTCAGEGFVPGLAFVACRIEGKCYRFATVNNCDYENFPRGGGLLPSHDSDVYCRKDHVNYTYFSCRVGLEKHVFQTTDAVHYYSEKDKKGDLVFGVAGVLPIPGGCFDKTAD